MSQYPNEHIGLTFGYLFVFINLHLTRCVLSLKLNNMKQLRVVLNVFPEYINCFKSVSFLTSYQYYFIH